MNKLISVILPVRNGEKYIYEAVESILNQDYKNFEFIIINDGSSDNTKNILLKFKDTRMKIIDTNGIGLISALNLGLKHARGEYIARMDGDDISMSNRFSEQIKILEKHKDIGVVCSDIIKINEHGDIIGEEVYKIKNHTHLIEGLTFKTKMKPIIHPSVMCRKELIDTCGGYRNFNSCEDLDLWLRLTQITNFFRIPNKLLKYRILNSSISRKNFFEQKINSLLAVLNYEVNKVLKIDLLIEKPEVLEHFKKDFQYKLKNYKETNILFEEYKKKVYGKNKFVKIIKLALEKDVLKIIIYYINSNRIFVNLIKNATILTKDLISKIENNKKDKHI